MKNNTLKYLFIIALILSAQIVIANPKPKDPRGCLLDLEIRPPRSGNTLILNQCELEDDAMPVIARYLKANPEFDSLFIGYNNITSKGISSLAEVDTLVELEARNNDIDGRTLNALSNNKNLKYMMLDNNKIDDEGAASLAKINSLRGLTVDNNHISDNGAKSLANLPNLVSVSLRNNYIGPTGARAFASSNNDLLCVLDLSGNMIGDDGFIALAQSSTLPIMLILESNHITDKGMSATFVNKLDVYELNLSHNDITDKGIETFIKNNQQYLPIGGLTMDYNHLSKAGIEKLTEYAHSLSANGNDGLDADSMTIQFPTYNKRQRLNRSILLNVK